MSPERWQQIDRILNQALDLPTKERAPFLETECRSDVALLDEVKTLLAAHADSEEFLDAPALRPGARLGAYRIIRELGRGGMGVVFLAERDDDQFQKQVAIKILASTVGSGELVRRFRDERRILARLENPNLARLLDAGATPGGLRYIVMEYVEGDRLDTYCRERTIEERLTLFQQVCSAVQFAHRNLVIHRDIKPGNILIASDGTVKLLDFGIAKMLDSQESGETTVVQAMTPEYASPEQLANLPVTTACDVYSLGIVLRKLVGEGSEDLAAIVSKATRSEPVERYASAEELSGDIDRYLRGLPVLARRGTMSYVSRKFARRHSIAVTAALVVLLLGTVGIIAVIRQTRIANQQRARAQLRFDQLHTLARSVMYEMHDGIAALPGSTPVRALLVKRSLEYLDSLAKDTGGDYELQRELAGAYQRVGDVQGGIGAANLGDTAGALAAYGKARTILEGLLPAGADDEKLELHLLRILNSISAVQATMGNRPEAAATAHEAVRRAERFVQHNRGDAAISAEAGAYFSLGAHGAGYDEQHRAFQRAVELYSAQLQKSPNDPERIRNLALTYKAMASVSAGASRLDEYLQNSAAAYELDLRRMAINPGERNLKLDLAFDLMQLAGANFDKKDIPTGIANLRKSLAIREELLQEDPHNAHLKARVAFAKVTLGQHLVKSGLTQEAIPVLREALSMVEALQRDDPKNENNLEILADGHKAIGDAEAKQHHTAASCVEYGAAVRYLAEVRGRFSDPENAAETKKMAAGCQGR
jgi:eukaryotic-like serine/threonine-protein kinase